jgi:hypothetical protein
MLVTVKAMQKPISLSTQNGCQAVVIISTDAAGMSIHIGTITVADAAYQKDISLSLLTLYKLTAARFPLTMYFMEIQGNYNCRRGLPERYILGHEKCEVKKFL